MSIEQAGAFSVLKGCKAELRNMREEEGGRLKALLSHPLVAPHIMLHRRSAPMEGQLDLLVYRFLRPSDSRTLHTGIYLRDSQELLGTVSFQRWNRHEHSAVLGYMLDPSWWGRGLATEAVGLLLGFGFQELGLTRVEGRCRSDNRRSERVMLNNGLRLERMVPIQDSSGDVMKVFTLLHN